MRTSKPINLCQILGTHFEGFVYYQAWPDIRRRALVPVSDHQRFEHVRGRVARGRQDAIRVHVKGVRRTGKVVEDRKGGLDPRPHLMEFLTS